MIATTTEGLDDQPFWLTVDSVNAMVVALKASHESDIFLTTYLGNILNHVYWFQIGTNENTEVKLLKNGIQVICCFSRKSETGISTHNSSI